MIIDSFSPLPKGVGIPYNLLA